VRPCVAGTPEARLGGRRDGLARLLTTFVFGLCGGLLAVRKRMGAFGARVLTLVAVLGGGALRDVLANEAPFVLEREIDAWAALAGVALDARSEGSGRRDGGGPAAATALRRLALRFGWQVPRPRADVRARSSWRVSRAGSACHS